MANKADVPDLPDFPIPKIISRRDDKIIDAAVEVEEDTKEDKQNISFAPHILTIAGLPHQDPKTKEFIRINGHYKMEMFAPGTTLGLPYGVYPRLILTWIATEATLKKTPELCLGETLPAFLRKLNITKSAVSTRGIIEQMGRLFNAIIVLRYEKHDGNKITLAGNNQQFLKEYEVWHTKNKNKKLKWNSNITLSDGFFNDIQKRPIPICIRTLRAIQQSPLAIDIYLWLTYRNCYLKKETTITWPQLHAQFGSNYRSSKKGMDNFRTAFLRELKKVTTIYQDAQYRLKRGRFILIPAMTSITRAQALIDERDERIKPTRCTDTKDMFE